MSRILVLALVCVNAVDLTCKVVCRQDGDELGVIIDSRCYCANQRDITRIIPRVGSGQGRSVIDPIRQKSSYFGEM